MLLITQLSKETGISVPTIRYYEGLGLFRGAKKDGVKSNNYTYYDEAIIYKIRLIVDAKSAGFTLAEIKILIDDWASKTYGRKEKLDILNAKLLYLDEKIRQLEDMKQQIEVFKLEV
jgi:MerR family transcriptional regulator, copper efflux regulator